PNNISYLTELAVTNYRLKNYNEAIANYHKISSLDSNNGLAYNSIGNIYWITKDYERAQANFQKAIEIDSNLISAYNNYALMLAEYGEKERSLEILKKGIEASSENSELILTLKSIQ
ncbi:tetratricopeptide repeat protein, partial [Candidatus Parcubacteria bacterium]|nr:tetratricopeptide repeat protein [Candidatus Parcubacteria bacterium]